MRYGETLKLIQSRLEELGPVDYPNEEFQELMWQEKEVKDCSRKYAMEPRNRTETFQDLDNIVDDIHRKLSSQNKFVESLDGDEAPAGTTDPNGLDAHAPGAKLDQGKLRAGLVLGDFSNALEQVVKIGSDGAKKYTDHGWVEVPDGVSRYTDALYRHLLAHNQGESLDPESGSPHLAHACWNLLAVIELHVRHSKGQNAGSLSEKQA